MFLKKILFFIEISLNFLKNHHMILNITYNVIKSYIKTGGTMNEEGGSNYPSRKVSVVT